MNVYEKAAAALKDALKQSLDDNIESDLQSELWRHYQGVKSISSQIKLEYGDSIKPTFSPFTVPSAYTEYPSWDNINISSGSVAAGDTISFSTDTKDVVTFSWSSANRS